MQSVKQQCCMCSNTTTQRCKTCGCSTYCSKACQKADWPAHKLLCGEFLKFSTPPGPTFRRGILFPDSEKQPRFVWVACPLQPGEDGGPAWEYPNRKEFLGEGFTRPVRIGGNILRSRALQNNLEVFYREEFLRDGSKTNICVLEVTKGRMCHEWRGCLLAMKLPGLSVDPGRYIHIDMIDFRDVVDLFCTYPEINMSDLRMMRPTASPTSRPIAAYSGVRINCSGDMAGREKFEATKIPADHPVFSAAITSISKLIELPIKVIRCPPHDASQNQADKYDENNQAATFLHLSTNPNNRWGWAPLEWQEPAGSVIVVRADRKLLFPQHIEALCHYCQYILQPLFEDSMGMGMHPKSPMGKSEALRWMTPRAFEDFYVGYNNWKRDSDPKWSRTCPWPYPTDA